MLTWWLSSVLALSGSGEPTSRADLNENWVASDLERIAQMRSALAEPVLHVETLRAALGSSDVRDDRAIGFGARRVVLAVYGGYTTTWIHILAAERDDRGQSRVAAIRIEQEGSPASWAELVARLQRAWATDVKQAGRRLQMERVDPQLAGELRNKVEAALGRVTAAPPTDELAAAFDRLTSPFTDLVLGKYYGDDGAPHPAAARSRRSRRQVDSTSCEPSCAA